jgi:hypothetical protein
MKQFVISLLIFPSFISAVYSQHKYYVGKGPKGYPTTSVQALSTLALQAGDSLFFHGGDTVRANILLKDIHGNKAHNIILTSYGKGRGVIDGKNNAALTMTGSDHFRISNLTLIGSGRKDGNTTDGLKLANCSQANIKNVEVSGFQKSGLVCYNSESIELDSVWAHENGFAGILVEGDYQKKISNNIHIMNCRADNNPGDPTNLDNHSGNGILVGNCKNVLIEYCTASNNGWDMPRVGNGPVGIWAYEADSVTIQYCISYHNKTAKRAADGGGFDLDGGVTNSIIQYCLSYENWGSGYGIFEYYGADKWYNNTLRYCISINDGFVTDYASGMLIWNGWDTDSSFTNFYAYNNVFYNDRKYAFGFSEQGRHKKFAFFNNVFISADTSNIFDGTDSSGDDIFLGNVWMRKGGGFFQNGFNDLRRWSAAKGYEQLNGKFIGTSFHHTLFTLPSLLKITDPRSLEKNSMLRFLCNPALRNKGVDIRELFSINVGKTDFFGHALSSGGRFDAGVCETK